MKQIYNFNGATPPILNENMLQAKLERRGSRLQIGLLVAALVLTHLIILVFGLVAYAVYPVITLLCLGYDLILTAGSGLAAVVYTKKGGLIS